MDAQMANVRRESQTVIEASAEEDTETSATVPINKWDPNIMESLASVTNEMVCLRRETASIGTRHRDYARSSTIGKQLHHLSKIINRDMGRHS
jgi:hypothetical protein